MQFTFQLVGVAALCAPGLALLIGFYYGDAPPRHGATQITTTPPAPTALVSLGIIFLFSAVVHLCTITGVLLLDRLSFLAGRPLQLEPYARAGRLLVGTGQDLAGLAGLLVLLLMQVAIGLWAGRRIPDLVLGDVLPLSAVYGWTRPYVEAARDPLKTVFATVILKTNARDARLVAYEGALDFLRLDGDATIRSIVLRPAERLILSTDLPRGDDGSEGGETDPDTLEVFRENARSATLTGSEIHSVSFAIYDLGALTEADEVVEGEAAQEASSAAGRTASRWWLGTITALLFAYLFSSGMTMVAAPSAEIGDLMPGLGLPWRWFAGGGACLATLFMLGHVDLLRVERRSFRWLVTAAVLAGAVCGAVAALRSSLPDAVAFQVLVASLTAAVSAIAVFRLDEGGGPGVVRASWLLAALYGLAGAQGLQAVERLSVASLPTRGIAEDTLLLASGAWLLLAVVVGRATRWGGPLKAFA